MSDRSGIEWCHATWNPVTGCTKVSPGCAHCYIDRTPPFRIARRRFERGRIPVVLHPERLAIPLTWKKPRRIFVNSLSDLFHEEVPDDFIGQVFEAMMAAARHEFLVLTKRPERALALSEQLPWPENVWLGVSVETQRYVARVDVLRRTGAKVKFLSCEPLLGPLSLDLAGIDWVIAGGESGPKARRMDPPWARGLRDQCLRASVPFFFKQWGAFDEGGRRVGKKRAGNMLDGRTWDEFPRGDQSGKRP